MYSCSGPIANSILNWWPMDSEERFNMHMLNESSANRLAELGWTDNSITYKFNSDGFRCNQELTPDSDSIMFLGCSLTAGIGIPNESTWAYQVAEHLGLACYNLGWPGGSPDTVFRMAQYWIPLLKPKQIVCLWPQETRREIFLNNTIQQQVTMVDDNTCYTEWLSDERNYHYQFLKNRLALEHVCSTAGTPLLQLFQDDCDIFNIDHCARDLAHPGIDANTEFAKTIISNLENS